MTWQKWLLGAILLVALGLRFWNLHGTKMVPDESAHYFPEMQQSHELTFAQQRIHPTYRYHGTSPNPVGHPMFAIQVVNVVMRLLGPTDTVGRGVMALCGLLLVAMVYLLGRDLYDEQHGLVAAAIAALLPEAVRYQRTLYLDPLYSLLTAAWVWCLHHGLRRPVGQLKWLVAAGVLLGLAAATKTSAPLLVVLALAYGIVRSWQERGLQSAYRVGLMLVVAYLVFFVFVSPESYWQAIRNPVDDAYQNMTVISYLSYAWEVRDWLVGVGLYLWTPPLLLAAVAGLVFIGLRWLKSPGTSTSPAKETKAADALVVLWLIANGPLFFLHLQRLSAEHGYLSFVSPIALLAAVGLFALPRRWLLPALMIVLLPMIPTTILYGLRLVPVPYDSFMNLVDVRSPVP